MASVPKEPLTPPANPEQLRYDEACSSVQVCDYYWTEGLDRLFEMAPPLDTVPSIMVDDHLQVQSSDTYWDNEEWASQVKSAEIVPMAPHVDDVPVDGKDNECPFVLATSCSSSLPTSFMESPGADSVSVVPPSRNVGLPSCDEHSVSIQKTSDINGNCITGLGTVKSSITTPGIIPAMNQEFIRFRLVPEVKPTAPATHGVNVSVSVSETPRSSRTIRVRTRSKVTFVNQAKQRHSRPLRLQFPNLETSLKDFLANLIRNAKFGKGEVQRVAQKELESLTMMAIQQRLLEMVPGLADRGISHTSIQRLLQPLTVRKIRKCLKDSSAWCAVNEVIVI